MTTETPQVTIMGDQFWRLDGDPGPIWVQGLHRGDVGQMGLVISEGHKMVVLSVY